MKDLKMKDESIRLSRRAVLQYFVGTGVLLVLGDRLVLGEGAQNMAHPQGYGTDPDLTKLYKPGDVWPLTLSGAQKKVTIALADVIFPADDLGPSASSLRVPDYIDEWVSAPYPVQQKVRPIILEGLDGLDAESVQRFKKPFAQLNPTQQIAMCDDFCDVAKTQAAFLKLAKFFEAFRILAAGAYYSTPAGWKAVGYVGNVPSATFDGPPPEVLKQLGVKQTV